MSGAGIIEIVLGVLAIFGSGGLAGVYFTNKREAPKSAAETANMDWTRFQAEIARLVDRTTNLEERVALLEKENSGLRRDKTDLEIENMRLKAAQEMTGQVRQEAAKVVALDRLQEGDQPRRAHL